MKKLGLTCFILLLLFSFSTAECIAVNQSGIITRVNSSDGKSLFPFNLPNNMLFANTEEPPFILENRVFLSTGWTYSFPYSTSNNFITNPLGFQQYSLSNPKLLIGGWKYVNTNDINNPIKVNPYPISESALNSKNPPFWSRSYYGVYSIEKIGNEYISFTHGENKNEYENNVCYQNTINPNLLCNACYSGTNSQGEYSECPSGYSSFIGMTHSNQISSAGFIDEGPVIWPTNGYAPANIVAVTGSLGMASHVSSIIYNNYIYLFYFNSGSGSSTDARNTGIKVARGLVQDGGRPGTFKTWYKLANGTEGWEDSLPSTWYSNGVYVTDTGKSIYSDTYKGNLPLGWIKLNGEDWYNFDGNWMQKGLTGNDLWWNYHTGWMTRSTKGFKGFNSLDNYNINGGRASNILGEFEDTSQSWYWPRACNDNNLITTAITEFIVAKLKGTEYFIGVENDFGWQIAGANWNSVAWTGLRVSKDLIHWSDLYVLQDTIAPTWQSLKLGHTKFLSGDFSSNKEVSPDGFYLIGSHGNGTQPCSSVGCWQQLNYKYLKISITEDLDLCTEENWTYTDGTCQSNNKLTRTWTKSGLCTNGITHPATEQITCTFAPINPICSQYPNITYSQTQVNNFRTQWAQNNLSLNDFMNKIRIWKYCSN